MIPSDSRLTSGLPVRQFSRSVVRGQSFQKLVDWLDGLLTTLSMASIQLFLSWRKIHGWGSVSTEEIWQKIYEWSRQDLWRMREERGRCCTRPVDYPHSWIFVRACRSCNPSGLDAGNMERRDGVHERDKRIGLALLLKMRVKKLWSYASNLIQRN